MAQLLEQLETPHALVELERVRENVRTVQAYCAEHGLGLRPHCKTHKDERIGQLQLEAGALGLTVATAREAEVMSQVTPRLLVAYPPIDPGRIERSMRLPRDVELSLALDSELALERLAEASRRHERPVGVLIELDVGARRTGVDRPERLVALARRAGELGLRFEGVMLHPGHLRRPAVDPAERDPRSPRRDAAAELLPDLRRPLGAFLDALDHAHLPCSVVSGGNSPTLFESHRVPELTEIRPGTYVYSDRDLAAQGVLPWSSCAYSVLATVVSTAVSGQIVIDAGTKALGREPIEGLVGYGALLDDPRARVTRLSEEHGVLELGASARRFSLGDRVRVVPNHVCVSVHLQERVAYLERDALEVRRVPAQGRAPLDMG